ncbi:hypothetical protein Ahy_A03g010472 isoform G [Arachis hypogaea]|uniref:Uncharacterized protein n=1 Tax=Arachis hypogaea TaxID=3818 RepID=A0A445DMC4_ARAHY|nr:hypothetical protein Ahy_A03g010472 isoform G [Arachis hypogaea]
MKTSLSAFTFTTPRQSPMLFTPNPVPLTIHYFTFRFKTSDSHPTTFLNPLSLSHPCNLVMFKPL